MLNFFQSILRFSEEDFEQARHASPLNRNCVPSPDNLQNALYFTGYTFFNIGTVE